MTLEKTAQGNYTLKIKGREISLTPGELEELEITTLKSRFMSVMMSGLDEDGYDAEKIKADKALMGSLNEEIDSAVEEMICGTAISESMHDIECAFEDQLEKYEK